MDPFDQLKAKIDRRRYDIIDCADRFDANVVRQGHSHTAASFGTSSVPAMLLTLRTDLAGLFQLIHMSCDAGSRSR